MSEIVYLHNWQSTRMDSLGPGDRDVCTKDGRVTEISITLSRPTVQGSSLKTSLVYDIMEGRSDWTHLQMQKELLIPLPADWTHVEVVGAADFEHKSAIYGKNHRWNPIDVNGVNWIQEMNVKIDGKGDDTDGNAGLQIVFEVPLRYEKGPLPVPFKRPR